jgi:quercetin dioxygenase-like cupin family protein
MKTIEKQVAKTMKSAEVKNFAHPDEVREFPKGRLELVKVGGAAIGYVVLEPGWKWSESVKPIAKTKSCQAPHLQYLLSGVLKVRMDDGSEFECHHGDVVLIPPGHDAWVMGEVPVAAVDFQGMLDYAKAP